MKTSTKQTVKSIARITLFSLGLAALMAVISLGAALLTSGPFTGTFWQLCSGAGGFALLCSAVLLLTHRGAERKTMRLWEAHFPGLSFTAAILTAGAVLILCACGVNYIAF